MDQDKPQFNFNPANNSKVNFQVGFKKIMEIDVNGNEIWSVTLSDILYGFESNIGANSVYYYNSTLLNGAYLNISVSNFIFL